MWDLGMIKLRIDKCLRGLKMNFEILEMNGLKCPCPMKKCANHGNCAECEKYCAEKDALPFCRRNHGFFTKIFFRKSYKMVQRMKAEGLIS